MTNNKQQTAVDAAELAFKIYPFSSDEVRNAFITGYNKAKEMEKERMIDFAKDWYFNGPLLGEGIDVKSTIEQHFNNTYEEDEQ